MPTEWLKQTFKLNTDDLSALVTQICHAANTSIMACFYALENVLPAGELFFVKTDAAEYWKPFRSIDTYSFPISITKTIPFYDTISYWKKEYRISIYNVIHYKTSPAPDFSTLNDIYLACNSKIEELLSAITGGHPISAIPYINRIINSLIDKYYVVIQLGELFFRHFRHSETVIRMYDHYDNIEEMYDYIQQNFYDYGRIDFLPGFTMLWVKECWRGNNISDTEIDPNELLKIIVTELYPPDISHHMLQSINGIMASINSTHKTASRDQLYHFAKVRFETDPKYTYFAEHYYFDKYISGKTASLIRKRTIQ